VFPYDWGTFRAFTGELGFPHPIRDHNCVPLIVRLMRTTGDTERKSAAGSGGRLTATPIL
jgi:hypothetical protein